MRYIGSDSYLCTVFQQARRMFEQGVGRLRAELAGDKEAALSALRRENDEELQVTPSRSANQHERSAFICQSCAAHVAVAAVTL